MQLIELDRYIGLLDEAIDILSPSRVRQLEWLRYDLDTFARLSLDTALFRRAWDRIFWDRLDSIRVPDRIKSTIDAIKFQLRASSSGTSLKVHFGQQRVAGAFQVANINQQMPGFPADMAATTLDTVVNRLRGGEYLPDQLPIRIFWHANKWIAANNRGYTAHCLAGVRPLRMLPTHFRPADIEITRLAEVEGVNGIGPWIGNRGSEPSPRRLPSANMFVTPVANTITQVASVPMHWG